jgi:hypothetical protein
VTKEEISADLARLGKDRQWLAEATGYRYDYIKNSLAPGAPEPSAKFGKECRRAFEQENRRCEVSMTRPGSSVWDMVYFSAAEVERIDQARRAGGYTHLAELYKDAILDFTEHLMTDDEDHGYRAQPSQPAKPVTYRDLKPLPPARVAEDEGNSNASA